MAYLYKKPRTKRNSRRSCTRQERMKVYNDGLWVKMRRAHLMEEPLCEICKARGMVSAAEDVHHKVSFTQYEGDARMSVAFDPRNLVSVCKHCHGWLHRHGKTNGLDIAAVVDAMERENG